MGAISNPTRRQFLQFSATGIGGLMVGLPLKALANGASLSSRIGFFVEIRPDNSIIIHVPKPEIGQGVHTSLPMLLAEELDADFESISVKQLPVRLVPRENGEGYRWLHGSQDVGGSTSISDMFNFLRQAGAEVRRRLVLVAANHWDVSPSDCRTEENFVIDVSGGRRLSYGELAAAAVTIPEPDTPTPLKNPNEFKIIGTSQKMKGVEQIVRGQMEYGIDAEIPGMLHAVILRAPSLSAKLVSFDASEALALPGVRHVVAVEGPEPMGDFAFTPIADGVAVVADSHWLALKGRERLKVKWTDSPMRDVSSKSLDEKIQAQMNEPGQTIRNDGNFDSAIDGADKIIEREYSLPFVSHATLEPQGCIAHVREDGCDIIVSTQDSSDCVFAAAKWTGFTPEQINVRVTRSGGGFGRRLDEDYVPEAVQVSKAIGGKPVHVLWTREDDMRNDFYRPLVKHKFRIGLGSKGDIIAWHHKLASTGRYFRRPGVPSENIYIPEMWLDDFPAQLVENMKLDYFFVETAVPTGPWRAPGHTANVLLCKAWWMKLLMK
ncbi:MAG: xanthine dehydrogenase family protein molybdopterin-binding subunit [Alphaproteobacteria bacterium]|nr:MAG: xanthine dehydrogenase family protein molybdopterin-binding subunit [Alphaproteobacteria bacterium]